MSLTPITGSGHFNAALVRLAMPFWGRPRVAALLRAMVNRVQELEDDTWEVMNAFTIDGADTARLNILGRIVGQPRFWADDEVYRSVIRAKIRANRSRGLPDDIAEVVALITGVIPGVIYSFSPATATVTLGATPTAAQQTAIEYLLPKTRAGGVLLHEFIPRGAAPYLLAGSSRSAAIGTALGSSITGHGAALYSTRRI